MAVAVQRADDIAAAMQIEERGATVGIRGRCPFCRHSVCRWRLDRDIGGASEAEPEGIEILAHLPIVVGARKIRELRPQGGDLRIAHVSASMTGVALA